MKESRLSSTMWPEIRMDGRWGGPGDIDPTWRKVKDTKDDYGTTKNWSGVNRSGLIKRKLFMATISRESGLTSPLLENYRAHSLTLLHSKQTSVFRKWCSFSLCADKELPNKVPVRTLPSACILCFTTKQQCDCCLKGSLHLMQHVNFTQKGPEDLNVQPSCCECLALHRHAGCCW